MGEMPSGGLDRPRSLARLDTLDVWIDSGSSSRAVLMRRAELSHPMPRLVSAQRWRRMSTSRIRPASRLVSVVLVVVPRWKRRRPLPDRVDTRLHGGRGPREDFEVEAGSRRLSEASDRGALHQGIWCGRGCACGSHRRITATTSWSARNGSRRSGDLPPDPEFAPVPAQQSLRL